MPNKELYHGCSYRNRNGWRKLTDYERGKKNVFCQPTVPIGKQLKRST